MPLEDASLSSPPQSDVSPPWVERQIRDGICTLWLNRPLQYNVLSEGMLDALDAAFRDVAADPGIRCVVLAARGKAFSAGHDLREMRAQYRLDYYRRLFARCSATMQTLMALPVPVIARVQGIATAAGCQLVASCDLAVASESARFAVSGIRVGLFCATPAVALSRNVGTKRAFDMLSTGRFVDAATAEDWGLVNRAVPDEQLDEAVAFYTTQLCARSPAALRRGKAMFYRQRQMPLQEAYAFAAEAMAHNMMEADAAEGIDAFFEQRAPVWGQPNGGSRR